MNKLNEILSSTHKHSTSECVLVSHVLANEKFLAWKKISLRYKDSNIKKYDEHNEVSTYPTFSKIAFHMALFIF